MTKTEARRLARRNGERVSGSRAAQILGVDRRTITRWAERGRFPGAYRLSNDDWAIPLESVNRVVLEKEKKPMANAQLLEQVDVKYKGGVVDMMFAAQKALEYHYELVDVAKAGTEASEDLRHAFRQSVETLVDAALVVYQISTVRANMIALAIEAQTPAHPEDRDIENAPRPQEA